MSRVAYHGFANERTRLHATYKEITILISTIVSRAITHTGPPRRGHPRCASGLALLGDELQRVFSFFLEQAVPMIHRDFWFEAHVSKLFKHVYWFETYVCELSEHDSWFETYVCE